MQAAERYLAFSLTASFRSMTGLHENAVAKFADLRRRDPIAHAVVIDSLYDFSRMLYSALIVQGALLESGYPVPCLDAAQQAAARSAVALYPAVAAAWPRLETLIEACDEDSWRRETFDVWLQVLGGASPPVDLERHLADQELASLDARNLIHLAGLVQTTFGSEVAEPIYRRAELDRPSLFWPHISLGVIAYEKRDFQEARRQLEAARALNPFSGRVQSSLCGVYSATGDAGDFDLAIRSGRKAIEFIPDSPRAHYNLGLALTRGGKTNEGITEFEHSIEIDPDYFPPRNMLGQEFAALEQYDDAIAAYEEALRVDPDSPEALTGNGNVFWRMNDLESALPFTSERSTSTSFRQLGLAQSCPR
jgi:tetratricopeptide (TPR) repeat protein